MNSQDAYSALEAAFLLEISRLSASAACAREAFKTVGEAAACAAGIHGLTLELADDRGRAITPQQLFGNPDPEANLSVVSPLNADGYHWGWARLYFDPQTLSTGTAERLSRFLGEQLGLALGCIDLEAQIAGLRELVAAGEEEIRTRKVVTRAAAILARRRGISEKAAKMLIEEQSQRIGKDSAKIAEAILLANSNRLTRDRNWSPLRLRRTA